jgi:ABC-type nickel/cobalt efflux system permease component RcnA
MQTPKISKAVIIRLLVIIVVWAAGAWFNLKLDESQTTEIISYVVMLAVAGWGIWRDNNVTKKKRLEEKKKQEALEQQQLRETVQPGESFQD